MTSRSHESSGIKTGLLPFGTKAETLEAAGRLLCTARVLPLFYFSRAEWTGSRQKVLADLFRNPWVRGTLIVRSSAWNEDQPGDSGAGKYRSLTTDAHAVDSAIDRVFDSYGDTDGRHQVLIQPLLQAGIGTGVAASVEPGSGAPYRVVSWAEGSAAGRVTAGQDHCRTWYCAAASHAGHPVLQLALQLLDEVEILVAPGSFEVEFGLDSDGLTVLFQVRRLCAASRVPSQPHRVLLQSVASRLESLQSRDLRILGTGPLFGVMPDWNPAEMIGIRPLPLARSLYRYLITGETWAMQRHRYGYRDLRGIPLMVEIYGHAAIDVRASFTSFVPAGVSESTAAALVDAYTEKLRRCPHLHDKIEFEVALTCLALDSDSRIADLATLLDSVQRAELRDSLRRLTNRVVHGQGLWRQELSAVAALAPSRRQRASEHPLARARTLLESARSSGALPFAGLARCAFIATELLNSAVRTGVLTAAEQESFFASLATVTSRLRRDLSALEREEFLARYGHLRPGTYDIRSPRYDQAPDLYFDWKDRRPDVPPPKPFVAAPDLQHRLDKALGRAGLEFDHAVLLEFAAQSIAGRESAKLEFTHNVSDALVCLENWGAEIGVTVDDLAWVDLQVFWQGLEKSAGEQRELILREAEKARALHHDSDSIRLPSLIRSSDDVWCFELLREEPSFITRKRASGPVAKLQCQAEPRDAIVCIESADPGYDWIFTCGIRGLVTAYGGVNSHMAIRCLELGIPAALGCGWHRYQAIANARVVEIDAGARSLSALS